MTLKEELEILRGEPIELKAGNPMDIPCIETSDSEKLCKHPVVSVHMTTYNHEPYIRQAIEGVMMQKTDFEFELIIGEDCSQDKTREICFEYQKKYPDKVRVLWSNENLYHIKGNSARCACRYRGDFIAFCEGDDYWIDPLKLQKQVDVMRHYPNVGWCFTGAKIHQAWDGKFLDWNPENVIPIGVNPGIRHMVRYMFGNGQNGRSGAEKSVMTATVLYRKALINDLAQDLEIGKWRLAMGDIILFWSADSASDVYYLPDQTAVYNRNLSGASFTAAQKLGADTSIVSFYFFRSVLKQPMSDFPLYELCKRALALFVWQACKKSAGERIRYAFRVLRLKECKRVFFSPLTFPMWLCLLLGIGGQVPVGLFRRLYRPGRYWPISKKVRELAGI